MADELRIEVDCNDAPVDQQVFLRVSGAQPGEHVTVHSRLTMEPGDLWESELSFCADDGGCVDMATAAPVSGPYSEPHPMGFLWSMLQTAQPDAPAAPSLRTAEPLEVDVEVRNEAGQRAALTLTRRFIVEGVRRQEIRERGLIGTLFEPTGARPNPVVVCFGGSEGGLNEQRAALYASHGFSALALAYFGVDPLPLGAREIPLEYFGDAFAYLVDAGVCDANSIAVDGASYGGQLVLLLASKFDDVCCTIANVPSGLIHSSVDVAGESEVTSAFTKGGRPLPFVQFRANAVDWRAQEIALAPGYTACFDHEDEVSAATIQIERAQGPVLMLSGQDDRMWPSRELAEVSAQRLRDAEFVHYFEHVCYGDAGHLATTAPYVPTNISSQQHPVIGRNFAFGGTALANVRASEDAWKRSLDLLRLTFSGPTGGHPRG